MQVFGGSSAGLLALVPALARFTFEAPSTGPGARRATIKPRVDEALSGPIPARNSCGYPASWSIVLGSFFRSWFFTLCCKQPSEFLTPGSGSTIFLPIGFDFGSRRPGPLPHVLLGDDEERGAAGVPAGQVQRRAGRRRWWRSRRGYRWWSRGVLAMGWGFGGVLRVRVWPMVEQRGGGALRVGGKTLHRRLFDKAGVENASFAKVRKVKWKSGGGPTTPL